MVRSDAARNHAALLACADELFARSSSPAAITMDDVAATAGVGKGTLFRRFGDRAGLIRAVVEHRSASLRDAVEDGPPPLGPQTPPRERLGALLDTVLEFKLRNRALTLAVESLRDGNPYGANYQWMHRAIATTVAELALPIDASWLAHALLGAVRADLVEHLVEHGMSKRALKTQLALLVKQVVDDERSADRRR